MGSVFRLPLRTHRVVVRFLNTVCTLDLKVYRRQVQITAIIAWTGLPDFLENLMLDQLARLKSVLTGRESSWDTSGRNNDAWWIEPGESRVLADIEGPGCITHIWMTHHNHYREALIKITWDNARFPAFYAP